MKPVSLCLIRMGQKGLELVDTYPEVLPKEALNQIAVKSMPFNARDGDFSTSTVGDNVISGYVFAVPSQEGRSNIASLVAVFDSLKFDPETIKKVFSFTITELKKNNLIEIDTLSKILPNLYKGLAKKQLKIKISSVVTLEFDFREEEEEEKAKELDKFSKEIWK